ncbi:MAG TPA: GNAT family N-acetyltransferase [Pyrinomonadaceae bacterium]|jgi:ribosomal protein S18 acetylase RimI-like enzyme
MFEIRELKSGEYEFLREMLYEAIYFADENQKLPKSIVFEPQLSKYIDNFGRKGDLAFVVLVENELVGAIWARLFPESNQGYGFFDEATPELSMAIKENYRNRGFGTSLLKKLLEALKINGFEKVSLSVDKRNRALDLYRRIGFETVSEQQTSLTMLKKL